MQTSVPLFLAVSACEQFRDHAGGGRPQQDLPASHRSILNRTYLTLGGRDLHLDVYTPREIEPPVPTVLYLHGGGWTQGAKEKARPDLAPYLEAGWAVVNSNYRVAPGDLAPAAVEDAVCALRWVAAHAPEYGFDLRRIVVAGYSTGGHLALMLGLLPDSASFGTNCPATLTPHPAVVVNIAGITDVEELLAGPTRRDWAANWIGNRAGATHLAASVSPLSWVRAGVAGIVTVHGKADSVVPYGQAVRLHQALDHAGIANRLITVERAGHWVLQGADGRRAMAGVMEFLVQRGLTPLPRPDSSPRP